MVSPTLRSDHLGDGALLALHDGEHGVERERGHAHLEHCDACRARLAAIAEQSARLHHSLDSIPVPPVSEQSLRHAIASGRGPSVRVWRRPVWLAAAAVIIVTAAAAAGPVRDWLRRVAHARLDGAHPVPSHIGESAPTADRAGATISFAPSGSEFTVRFDSLPSGGSLSVAWTADATISAHVSAGAGTGGDDMVLLPGEIRVRNSGASRASYELSVPSVVRRVRVIVDGRSVFDGAPPARIRLDRPR